MIPVIVSGSFPVSDCYRKLLAESAVEKGNYEVAEKAFVCCRDYQGIQFCKRLRKLDVCLLVLLSLLFSLSPVTFIVRLLIKRRLKFWLMLTDLTRQRKLTYKWTESMLKMCVCVCSL